MTTEQVKRIKSILTTMPDFEDAKTKMLLEKIDRVKKQGYFTKSQTIEILKWKSPRPLRHYENNAESSFKEITSAAFSFKDEKMKIHILTALTGVKIPAASSILMFFDKTIFPVIDIRVWQQLHEIGLVSANRRGQNFTLSQWENYLVIIRRIAKENKLSARQVEKRIFDYDRQTRRENLYKTIGKREGL